MKYANLLFILFITSCAAQTQFDRFMDQAAQGDSLSQYNICVAYLNAIEVSKNPAKAAPWCEKSADQGYARAQAQLGMLYDHGYGVEKDTSKAVYWYELAVEQGSEMAMHNLGASYALGDGVEKDLKKAADLYYAAAKKGYADSMFAIARMYQFGEGVTQSDADALAWYTRLAVKNDPRARPALKNGYDVVGLIVSDNKTAILTKSDGSGMKLELNESENTE